MCAEEPSSAHTAPLSSKAPDLGALGGSQEETHRPQTAAERVGRIALLPGYPLQDGRIKAKELGRLTSLLGLPFVPLNTQQPVLFVPCT